MVLTTAVNGDYPLDSKQADGGIIVRMADKHKYTAKEIEDMRGTIQTLLSYNKRLLNVYVLMSEYERKSLLEERLRTYISLNITHNDLLDVLQDKINEEQSTA